RRPTGCAVFRPSPTRPSACVKTKAVGSKASLPKTSSAFRSKPRKSKPPFTFRVSGWLRSWPTSYGPCCARRSLERTRPSSQRQSARRLRRLVLLGGPRELLEPRAAREKLVVGARIHDTPLVHHV